MTRARGACARQRWPGASAAKSAVRGASSGTREIDPATRIVVLTGYGSVATAVEALRRGAVHYLTKPADADEILAAFERSLGDGAASAPLEPMTLDRVEWEHINRVLVECGGNVSEAARLLGLHRRTLQRKLSKYPAKR